MRKLELPKIEPHERTPLVDRLIEIINQQREDIVKLIEEVNCLKKQPRKPKIKPNSLEPSKNKGQNDNSKGKGSKEAKAKKQPDRIEILKVESLPDGSVFKGYRYYVLQELTIRTEKVLYKLERWKLPDGSYTVAKLPKELHWNYIGSIDLNCKNH